MRQNETEETRSSRKRRLVAALIGAALVSGVAYGTTNWIVGITGGSSGEAHSGSVSNISITAAIMLIGVTTFVVSFHRCSAGTSGRHPIGQARRDRRQGHPDPHRGQHSVRTPRRLVNPADG